MRLGFVGVGVINSALVHAFCKSDLDVSIYLSPRNKEKAEKLKDTYKDKITIAKDNQEVIDNSDYVFLAVLPTKCKEIYSELKFRKDLNVINLTRVESFDWLKETIKDYSHLVYIIPLVFIQNVRGPIVMYPKDDVMKEFLSHVGDIVDVDSWQDTSTLQAVTGLEAPFFSVLDVINRWCKDKNMDIEKANRFSACMFKAMSDQASIVSSKRVEELSNEYTEGGLNYKAKMHLKSKDSFEEWRRALDSMSK